MDHPKKIALFVKHSSMAREKAEELSRWFSEKGMRVVIQEGSPPAPDLTRIIPDRAPDDLCCVVVLGGDGSFLSAARWVGERPIPILGVKFGEIGFLSESTQDNLYSSVEALISGKFAMEKRNRLRVRVMEGDRIITDQLVLNDAVVTNDMLARLANIVTHVDGEYLTTYRADGLIVATPTGSTAYSLAAGGPILHPAVSGIILTPICPFALTNRPLIVPDSASVTLSLEKEASRMTLTFDGQAGITVSCGQRVEITKSDHPVLLVKVGGPSYFDVLKQKLRWSGGRP
ncbi:MAG: NAD(+)/NADH kinase [Thermodesulfobacteriota bacterium]